MCNQQETCSEWITLHRIDGEEIQLEAGSIIGLVPYTPTYAPGTTVITRGGYNIVVREHISEIKELLDFDMVDVNDREKLLNQIDTQADTILQQSKTIEYWMKQHDETAKQLRNEHDANERYCKYGSTLMDDNSRLTKERDAEREAAKNLQVKCDQHWAEIVRLRAESGGRLDRIEKMAAEGADLQNQLTAANLHIASLTETCANQRKKICDMADGGPDMGLSLRREIARLKNDIVGLKNKIIKKDVDIASLTQKLNEVTGALKKVTEERDQAIIRAKNAEYDANVLRDRFCYTSQNGPSANAQRYGYSVIISDGLSDYAKWPGTK